MKVGEYQATNTPGFYFGVVVGPLLVVASIALLVWKGLKGNEEYAFSHERANRFAVMAWRILVLIYASVALVLGFTEQETNRVYFLLTFTRWNWILIMVYFCFGIAVCFMLPSKNFQGGGGEEASRCEKFVFYSFQMLGEIVIPSAILLTAMAWGYLVPEAGDEAEELGWFSFYSIAMHATNILIVFADFFLAGYLFNAWHFSLCLLWPALFVCVHLIANAAWGVLAYGFFETDETSFIIWVLALAVAMVALFFLCFGLSKLKQRFCCVRTSPSSSNLDSSKV